MTKFSKEEKEMLERCNKIPKIVLTSADEEDAFRYIFEMYQELDDDDDYDTLDDLRDIETDDEDEDEDEDAL